MKDSIPENQIINTSLDEKITLQDYILSLFDLTTYLLEASADTACECRVKEICAHIDEILLQMKYAEWVREIG